MRQVCESTEVSSLVTATSTRSQGPASMVDERTSSRFWSVGSLAVDCGATEALSTYGTPGPRGLTLFHDEREWWEARSNTRQCVLRSWLDNATASQVRAPDRYRLRAGLTATGIKAIGLWRPAGPEQRGHLSSAVGRMAAGRARPWNRGAFSSESVLSSWRSGLKSPALDRRVRCPLLPN